MFEVILYTTANGKTPITVFLASLPGKLRVKTVRNIALLEEYGRDLREPFTKPIADAPGLFELRTSFSGDITRIFFFFIVGGRIILTNGFVKKTEDTPRREIETALRYKADYERRVEQGEV